MSDSIFTVNQLYTLESPKVEAVAYSNGSGPNELCIFTAVKGGRLYEHIVKAEPRTENRTSRKYSLVSSISTVASKKKITKILPIRSLSRVLVLSNGVLSAFDFTSLSPIFCDISVTNILDMGINGTLRDNCLQFWILVKKRVILYTFSQGQFAKLQEIPLADTPLLVSWIGPLLLLQSKDSLLVMDLSTPQSSTTFKTALKNSSQATLRLLSNHRLFFSTSPTSFSLLDLPDLSDGSDGSDGPRSALPRETSLSYTSPAPSKGVCFSSPFIFVQSDALHVLEQWSLRPVDSLPLPTAQLLCDMSLLDSELQHDELGVVIAVLADGAVCAIDLRDADATISRFSQTGDVAAAFDLLHRNEAAGNTAIDKRQMHRQACLTFFAQLDFAQAFHHAWEARIPPAELLPLFPELLVRPLPESAVLTADLIGRNVRSVLEFVVATKKQHSSDPSAIRPDSEEVKTAVNLAQSQLLEFLWKFHAESQGENRGEDEEGRVVDVALFRLLLSRGDARLAGFIAGATSCEEEDVRESLVSRGLYNALASFYIQKKRPRDALQLWRELGEGALREDGVDGVSLTCQFLRNRTEADTLELMRAFLPWVMDRNPDEGYKVVIFGEVSTVPIASFVLGELDRVGASNYRSSYIQYLVVMNHVDDPALTTEFIVERIHLLLRQVQEHALDLAVPRMADTPSLVRDQRGQILSFLENNQSYDAAQVLSEIEDSPLFFEKVVVLGRLGRYEESLRIVVYELKSISYACSCCAKFPASSWYLLIRILFSEQDEEWARRVGMRRRRRESFREAALRVLEEHAYEIDPIEVLKIIPEDLTLQQLLQYYQSVVPHSTNVMREARIQRGMEQVRTNQLRRELNSLKNSYVMVNGGETCAVCGEEFRQDDCMVIDGADKKVHERCCKEKEIEVLNDLFLRVSLQK